MEESLWLCPIEDRRRLDSSREGMLEGFALGSYLLLVDYTGRLFPRGQGKDLQRSHVNPQSAWQQRGELVGPAGEAAHGPAARPILRGEPRALAQRSEPTGRASPREPLMDERMRRQWAALEATAYGWGGIQTVSRATGMSPTTIRRGSAELRARLASPNEAPPGRVRRTGRWSQASDGCRSGSDGRSGGVG